MTNTTESVETLTDDFWAMVYKSLRKGEWDRAYNLILLEMGQHLEDKKLLSGLKSIRFWQERQNNIDKHRGRALECALYWCKQWTWFQENFTKHLDEEFAEGKENIRYWVFAQVLYFLEKVEFAATNNLEYSLLLGLSYKGMGKYELAIKELEQACSKFPQNAALLAQIGDIHALDGHMSISSIYFREAFLINPQQIELSYMMSNEFLEIAAYTRRQGFVNSDLKEWMPVYGIVTGILSEARLLTRDESIELWQRAYAYKSNLEENDFSSNNIPRLIYCYLWLLDYLKIHDDTDADIAEILYEIKWISENYEIKWRNQNIYELYINMENRRRQNVGYENE